MSRQHRGGDDSLQAHGDGMSLDGENFPDVNDGRDGDGDSRMETESAATRRGPAAAAAASMGSFRIEGAPSRSEAAGSDAAVEKRRAIQAIMRDATLTDLERRLRIQQLMDGSSRSSDDGDVRMAGEGGGGGVVGRVSSLIGANGNTSRLPLLFGGGSNNGVRSASSTSFAAAGGGVGVNGGDRQAETVACVHYERKCNIVSPCCGRVFGCRVCHDEMSPACGVMDRFAIKEIVCKECNTRQGSKTNECIKCGVTFAEYHCPKCNIWMGLNKRPFHCDQCGFCRVGGREKFRHCVQCCMCISTSVYETHSCMTDKYKNNCPVCREDMFSSRQSPQDLPCGHAIHAHCFRNLAGFDYRCPICKKTVVSRESMSAAWTARARDIEMQPMPEDLVRVVNIMCIDCERKSENCNWHFLGVQCPGCSSFNTVVESQITGNAQATS